MQGLTDAVACGKGAMDSENAIKSAGTVDGST
jgi:hypothetical protein